MTAYCLMAVMSEAGNAWARFGDCEAYRTQTACLNDSDCLWNRDSGCYSKNHPNPQPLCVAIRNPGDPKNNLDLAIVGDKWTDIKEFRRYTNEIARLLVAPGLNAPLPGGRQTNLFYDYVNRINIWRVDSLTEVLCRHGGSCLNDGLFHFGHGDNGEICCDAPLAKQFAKACPADAVVVLENSLEDRGAVALVPDNPLVRLVLGLQNHTPLGYIWTPLYGNPSNLVGIIAQTRARYPLASTWTLSHELGHLIALLPDYYNNDSYPDCPNFPSKMCRADLDFGNKRRSQDRVRMVEQLNQFCNAEVAAVGTPYPNPFDPRVTTQKVKYRVSYPRRGEPCYIMMHVYNESGKEVRALVSDTPQPAGEYIMEWDGKNAELDPIASAVYFYVVTGGMNGRREWSRFKAKVTLVK